MFLLLRPLILVSPDSLYSSWVLWRRSWQCNERVVNLMLYQMSWTHALTCFRGSSLSLYAHHCLSPELLQVTFFTGLIHCKKSLSPKFPKCLTLWKLEDTLTCYNTKRNRIYTSCTKWCKCKLCFINRGGCYSRINWVQFNCLEAKKNKKAPSFPPFHTVYYWCQGEACATFQLQPIRVEDAKESNKEGRWRVPCGCHDAFEVLVQKVS